MKNSIKTAVLTGLLSVSFYAHAAVDLNSAGAKLLTKLTSNQVTITDEFKAANGWQGYVVQTKKQGSQAILYVDPTNHYLFAGALISADGTNLTQQYTDQYITQALAKGANQAVASTHWFSEGSESAPHKMYVVFDPNCIYCHLIYQALEPLIANKQLQVRWVPVGLIKPTSAGKAARLLSLKSNQEQIAALKQDETQFDSSQEEGGIAPLASDDSGAKQAFEAVQDNNAFFTQYQFIGTPVMLYTKTDGTPAISAGLVQGNDLEDLVKTAGSNW